ncbi:cysteine hydrolase family protein [Luteimonas pelagia]
MPGRRDDAPPGALLILDIVNPLDFPGAERLLAQAIPAARRLARLKARLQARGWPVVYANDNFTHWRNDFRELVAICSQDDCRGAPLVRALTPGVGDYHVLKPRHSAFFDTPLELLLHSLGTRRLAITGIAGDACVTATAIGAHMRGFDTTVVRDCTASMTGERNAAAMKLLRDMTIGVTTATALR